MSPICASQLQDFLCRQWLDLWDLEDMAGTGADESHSCGCMCLCIKANGLSIVMFGIPVVSNIKMNEFYQQ